MINKFTILNGSMYFSLGIFQYYLVFIPDKEYVKYFNGTNQIYSRISNGMSEGSIESITKPSILLFQLLLIIICYQM